MSASGCGGAQRARTGPPPPVDEDLVGLLPSGAEAVIDLDVEQLRAWEPSARLREKLGDAVAAPSALGFDLLADADAIAVAVAGAGTDGVVATWVVRGRLQPARLRAALMVGEERVEEVEYHDARLVEGTARALTMITPRTAAIGPRAEVRRIIDIASGNDDGLRRADGDRALREALGHVLEAKHGRPAVRAALRPPPPLRSRLEAAGIAGDLLEWLSVAVAVGDGIDVGAVAGTRDAGRVAQLERRLRVTIDELRHRPSLMLFGLTPFLGDLRTATRAEELHLAFRVEEPRFSRLLTRVERLVAAARAR